VAGASGVFRGAAAIVGAADLASPTGSLDRTARAVEVEVAYAALADAGLRLDDVDALFTAGGGLHTVDLAEYLGIAPLYTDGTRIGGASFEAHVEHATAAIACGLCEVALVVYAETPRSDAQAGLTRDLTANLGDRCREWELPSGIPLPMGAYALAASAHMARFGTSPEALASIAVTTRRWAAGNDRARYRSPITVEDVLASPMVAEPLHRLDCCVVTDGGGAIVLASATRARDLRHPPVLVLGAATAHTHLNVSQMPDPTITPGALTGPRALAIAGMSVDDLDVVELYDSFTITPLLALEDLGFCAKGEGGPFVLETGLGPGGRLPTNTSGGGLSYTHPGMFGIFLLVEATCQLRGTAGVRQVPGANVALAHGMGGVLSAASTVVLGSEATR
jgi:acetyl-CoA acetyltransferase